MIEFKDSENMLQNHHARAFLLRWSVCSLHPCQLLSAPVWWPQCVRAQTHLKMDFTQKWYWQMQFHDLSLWWIFIRKEDGGEGGQLFFFSPFHPPEALTVTLFLINLAPDSWVKRLRPSVSVSCKCKHPRKILEMQWKNQFREDKAVTKKSCWT